MTSFLLNKIGKHMLDIIYEYDPTFRLSKIKSDLTNELYFISWNRNRTFTVDSSFISILLLGLLLFFINSIDDVLLILIPLVKSKNTVLTSKFLHFFVVGSRCPTLTL